MEENKKLHFYSDGKKILIIHTNKSLNITQYGKKVNIPTKNIKKIHIEKRRTKFKPDLFFILYAIFSTALGAGVIYFLFRKEKEQSITWWVAIFVLISILAVFSMIKSANMKMSLFIESSKTNLEVPLDKYSDLNHIKEFFKELGFTVS